MIKILLLTHRFFFYTVTHKPKANLEFWLGLTSFLKKGWWSWETFAQKKGGRQHTNF